MKFLTENGIPVTSYYLKDAKSGQEFGIAFDRMIGTSIYLNWPGTPINNISFAKNIPFMETIASTKLWPSMKLYHDVPLESLLNEESESVNLHLFFNFK